MGLWLERKFVLYKSTKDSKFNAEQAHMFTKQRSQKATLESR